MTVTLTCPASPKMEQIAQSRNMVFTKTRKITAMLEQGLMWAEKLIVNVEGGQKMERKKKAWIFLSLL